MRVNARRRAATRRTATRPTPSSVMMAGPTVSDCAWDYLACLQDPFGGPLGCYPDSFAIPSTRYRVRCISAVTVGSGGYGFALLNPNYAMQSDSDAAYTTGATYAGSALVTTGTGVSATKFTQGPLATGDYSVVNGSQGRVVAAGVRMCYTGALSTVNGMIVPIESPDHTDLDGITWAQVTTYPGVRMLPVSAGQWVESRSSGPKNPTERDYSFFPSTNVGSYLGIIVKGTANDTYMAEFSVVFEVTGKKNLAPQAPKQDPVGLSHIQTMLNAIGPQSFNYISSGSLWNAAVKGVSAAAKVALFASAAAASPMAAQAIGALRTPGLGILPSSRVFG